MENIKEYCENLHQEYKKLKKERDYAFKFEECKPGEKVKTVSIPLKNRKRFYEVEKELLEKCKQFINLDHQ